jgi:hypothetical protein
MHIEPPTPIIARVVRTRRGAIVAVAALVSAALISACGSSTSSTSSTGTKTNLDVARVARSIEQNILAQRHLRATVVCPPVVPQELGRVFECIATTRSTKAPFTEARTPFVVTIKNKGGYVTYVGK